MAYGEPTGPILFGYCLDIFLYGILTVQTYLYYLAFPKDRKTTKVIVYFVYIVGMVQTALALRDFYTLFCTAEGQNIVNPPTFSDQTPQTFGSMWFTIPVGGVLVASTAQIFYAHRIYVISKARVVTGIVCLLAFIQLVCGIVSAVSVYRASFQSTVRLAGFSSLIAGGVAGVTCDLLIVIYMSRYLSGQMKGASRRTQVLITKVVRLLLETGILTAGMALAYVVLIFTAGYAFMIPGLSLGKLYANSMLVLLNNRFTIVGGRNAPHPDFDIPSYHRAEANSGPAVSRGITFARSRQAETTPSDGTIRAVELDPQPDRMHERSEEEIGNKEIKTEGIC